MPNLSDPLTINGVTIPNRIGMSPMCTYSAEDGFATDWHKVHYGTRAQGGCGLIILEATAIEPEGRISPQDIGIWSDDHIPKLAEIASFIKESGSIPVIQIAHAGRKAGTYRPWSETRGYILETQGGWERKAPSPIRFKEDSPVPHELTVEEITRLVEKFGQATERAFQAGFEGVEIHAAHGYLLHQFLSPISNQREDQYGGSFENRIRFITEVTKKVKQSSPPDKLVFTRFSCTDWVDEGWTLEDSINLASHLKPLGIDLIDCSSGGSSATAKIPVEANYQVPFAEKIKHSANIPTGAVGFITEANQANKIIESEQADIVLLGRELLRNPYWANQSLDSHGFKSHWPKQYAWPFNR